MIGAQIKLEDTEEGSWNSLNSFLEDIANITIYSHIIKKDESKI